MLWPCLWPQEDNHIFYIFFISNLLTKLNIACELRSLKWHKLKNSIIAWSISIIIFLKTVQKSYVLPVSVRITVNVLSDGCKMNTSFLDKKKNSLVHKTIIFARKSMDCDHQITLISPKLMQKSLKSKFIKRYCFYFKNYGIFSANRTSSRKMTKFCLKKVIFRGKLILGKIFSTFKREMEKIFKLSFRRTSFRFFLIDL